MYAPDLVKNAIKYYTENESLKNKNENLNKLILEIKDELSKENPNIKLVLDMIDSSSIRFFSSR